jgi:hypothetical protein
MMENIKHFMNTGQPVCGSTTLQNQHCPIYTQENVSSASSLLSEFSRQWTAPSFMQGAASSGQGITEHSWASFSAGQWYVLCSSYALNQSSGRLLPSANYITHEPFAAGDFPNGSYVNAIDAATGRAGGPLGAVSVVSSFCLHVRLSPTGNGPF